MACPGSCYACQIPVAVPAVLLLKSGTCAIKQGCEDAGSSHWIDLRHHHNDTTITMPGQYASWPVVSHAATTPFRMLRILLTGNNASSLPRRDTVNLSSFEFYGYLHTVNAQEAL